MSDPSTAWSNPSHPIWSILRLTIMMTALTLVLYVTANKFDETELQTIITMFLVASGIAGLDVLISRLGKGE